MITCKELLELHEAEKVSLTKAMVNALQKNTGIEFKKICQDCGFLINKYTGAYPKKCTLCGGKILDKDEEVGVVESGNYIGTIKLNEMSTDVYKEILTKLSDIGYKVPVQQREIFIGNILRSNKGNVDKTVADIAKKYKHYKESVDVNEAEQFVNKVTLNVSPDSWVIWDNDKNTIIDVKKPSKSSPKLDKYLDTASEVSATRLDEYIYNIIKTKIGQKILKDSKNQKKLGISVNLVSKDEFMKTTQGKFKDELVVSESVDVNEAKKGDISKVKSFLKKAESIHDIARNNNNLFRDDKRIMETLTAPVLNMAEAILRKLED